MLRVEGCEQIQVFPQHRLIRQINRRDYAVNPHVHARDLAQVTRMSLLTMVDDASELPLCQLLFFVCVQQCGTFTSTILNAFCTLIANANAAQSLLNECVHFANTKTHAIKSSSTGIFVMYYFERVALRFFQYFCTNNMHYRRPITLHRAIQIPKTGFMNFSLALPS